MEIAGGDHYFVSTHYRAVVDVVREQLVGLMAGGLMEGHSWVDEQTGAVEAHQVLRLRGLMVQNVPAILSAAWLGVLATTYILSCRPA